MDLVKRRVLMFAAVLTLLLAFIVGCGTQGSVPRIVNPEEPGAALFTSTDINAAERELAESITEITGMESVQDLTDLSENEEDLVLHASFIEDEIFTQAVLENADGNIAYIRHDRNCSGCQWQLLLANQSDDKQTHLYSSSQEINSVAVSLDGNSVVFAMRVPDNSNFDVYRLTVDSRSVSRLTNTSYDETNVSMSADGNTLVWEGRNPAGNRAVFIREHSGSSFTQSILSASGDQLDPSLSSNGRYIVLVRPVTGAYHVMRYDRTNNSYLTALKRVDVLRHPSISDDGNMLATLMKLSSSDRALIRDIAANATRILMSRSDGIEHPHLTADGNFLSYGILQNSSWNIFTVNLTSGQTARAVSSASPVNNFVPYWQKANATVDTRRDEDPVPPPPSEPEPPPSEPDPPPSEPDPPPSEPDPPPSEPDPPPPPGAEILALRVSGSSSGRSIQHIGANGDSSTPPRLSDIRDLGLTTYRLFGSTSHFEPTDDDGNHGSPTMSDMKRVLASNPSRVGEFVNLAAFDKNMRGFGLILKELYKVPGMQPLVVLRNSTNNSTFWIPRMSVTGSSCTAPDGSLIVWPQFTSADWNEWWQHVFAVVYWINVRNGAEMRVDRWSVHNEPNHQPEQGWCGTKEQYLEFVKYTNDAIDFVYETYLDNRPHWVHGGALSMRKGWEDWFRPMFRNGSGTTFTARNFYQPSMFDVIDMHPYGARMANLVSRARQLSRESGTASYVRNYPIWATEMGHYQNNQWDNMTMIIDNIVNNLIAGSTPGDGYVEGSLLWRMYDGSNNSHGLIRRDGTRRAGFYAMRLAVMALNGEKQVYPTQLATANANIMAITTREGSGSYNLFMTNRSTTTPYRIDADLSALVASGRAEVYLFNDSRKDASSLTQLSSRNFSNGRLAVDLPPFSVVLVQITP